ncbi:anti-sigma factor RsbA family regulatory protein [Actinokineospora auranticolor]|uniref:Histidine kinase-like protein n=1 Tax=Actinokineospora auranticolor TaxID=155976 RepID=A0A2S6GDD8_9PSEU|nr:anti-sigma factor RsbA family regulatory protein [Actinokineospora auranticolor]PPK63242.1 histidine kinase-like protein [Actinokineospora auranticolor]
MTLAGNHSMLRYGSDEELLAAAVPFLDEGLASGEPTIVSLGDSRADLLRGAVTDPDGLVFVAGDDLYLRPAVVVRAYRELLADLVDRGAPRVRIIGEIPRSQLRHSWEWWARYEAAVEHVYADFPLWSVCSYDTRVTPPAVLAEVARTHAMVAAPTGLTANPERVDPRAFLAEPRSPLPYPVQESPPAVELLDPTPGAARRAVRAAAVSKGDGCPDGTGLGAEDLDNLVLSVSEIVTNALRHGRPPVRVRVWPGPRHVVVTVHDTGPGPRDPFAGLLPAADRDDGGFGLWIAHQLCADVAFTRHGDGFTVRLAAGNPFGG